MAEFQYAAALSRYRRRLTAGGRWPGRRESRPSLRLCFSLRSSPAPRLELPVRPVPVEAVGHDARVFRTPARQGAPAEHRRSPAMSLPKADRPRARAPPGSAERAGSETAVRKHGPEPEPGTRFRRELHWNAASRRAREPRFPRGNAFRDGRGSVPPAETAETRATDPAAGATGDRHSRLGTDRSIAIELYLSRLDS